MITVSHYEYATDLPAHAIVTDGTSTARVVVFETGDDYWAPFAADVDDATIPAWVVDPAELDTAILAAARVARSVAS